MISAVLQLLPANEDLQPATSKQIAPEATFTCPGAAVSESASNDCPSPCDICAACGAGLGGRGRALPAGARSDAQRRASCRRLLPEAGGGRAAVDARTCIVHPPPSIGTAAALERLAAGSWPSA
eukprot:364716-Chlamydomonas_euryale.AAC.8